jgi:hypothetical protein
MAGYVSTTDDATRARVAAGYKGGIFFKTPILHPAMTIVNGVQPEVKAEFMSKGIPAIKVEDPWYSRR